MCRIVEHLGSAHDEAELAALMHLARQRLLAGQQVLDLLAEVVMHPVGLVDRGHQDGLHPPGPGPGRGHRGDRTFEQMVAARLTEPTSKAAPRALVRDRLAGTGPPRHPAGLSGALRRAGIPRAPLPRSLFDHVTATRGLALCL